MAPLAADAKGKSRPVVSAAGRGAHCRARSGGVQFKRLFKIVTGFARRERCGDMTVDPNEFTKQLFTAGQQPASWLRSAGRLRDAAEAIIKHELPAERSYFQAWKIADEEASLKASAMRPASVTRTSRPSRQTIHRLSYYMPMPSRMCSRASLYSNSLASSKNADCTTN
jgi:hypothetical protein